jgi:saccharopine dehydrogenase-like NADP-dependent oxidoreductase
MKHIVVLGAGQSTPYLISYLLNCAEEHDWFITVADLNGDIAEQAVAGHHRGQGIAFDINDAPTRTALISKAQVVINMLTRPYQYLVALECLNNGAHMLTASYEEPRMQSLSADAHRKNILILNEMGLDPGIDHMKAMQLIQKVRARRGTVLSFVSYGGGLPAPEANTNPLRYAITWNPRNVLMAGEDGALYREDEKIKLLPFHQVFERTWTVDVDGVGTFEAYPNRDSLSYEKALGLRKDRTIIRGTLRYPGWSETWQHIVHLGLANETLQIPGLQEMSYRDLTEMCLPLSPAGAKLEHEVADYLGISRTGRIMENLRWLGLFSDERIRRDVTTVAGAMIDLIRRKLRMPEGARDMVILVHEIEAVYPEEGNKREKITSTMIDYGTPGGFTAISRTVGLPIAVAAKLLLRGDLPLTGCQIPTHPAVYGPVLRELTQNDLVFTERIDNLT